MTAETGDKVEHQGHCLCGKVSITATNASNDVGACHCKMCRRWGGGPFMEIDCGVDFDIDGEDYVSVFNSSAWAERGFCRNCGTHLFYRLKESGQHMVPVGLFADSASFVFKEQVFVDEKPKFYEFANETKDFTGAELFARFDSS